MNNSSFTDSKRECPYCGRDLQREETIEHVERCGLKSTKCIICQQQIKQKEMSLHQSQCTSKNNEDPLSSDRNITISSIIPPINSKVKVIVNEVPDENYTEESIDLDLNPDYMLDIQNIVLQNQKTSAIQGIYIISQFH